MTTITGMRPSLPPSAKGPVAGVASGVCVLLLALSPWYGYHRD